MALLLLTGCEKAMQNMYDQPRYQPLEKSEFFPDGQSSRPLVANTVARTSGALAGASSGRTPADQPVTESPPVTAKLLARGRERYNIYCSPCHSEVGDGDGIVPRRGFPYPPSYHSDRLRSAPDQHFYRVISEGYGVMYSYNDRIAPADRWAIVAYIRALQLSQHAPLASVPDTERSALEAER